MTIDIVNNVVHRSFILKQSVCLIILYYVELLSILTWWLYCCYFVVDCYSYCGILLLFMFCYALLNVH